MSNTMPHTGANAWLGSLPSDWTVKRLSQLCSVPFKNGLYKPPNAYGTGFGMVHMTEVFRDRFVTSNALRCVKMSSKELEAFGLQPGDLLFARRSLKLEGVGKCALVVDIGDGIVFESSIIRCRPNTQKAFPKFIFDFVESTFGRAQMMRLARQVAVSGVASEDLKTYRIPVPPLPEQQKIAQILSTWDRAIDTLEALIAAKQKRKTALMQQLLTGKWRLPGFGAPAENGKFPQGWTKLEIGKLLDRVKKSVQVNLEDSYQEIGIRSHGKGIFHKEVIKGDKLGNKSVFWIEPACFVVNIVFAWEQAVAKTTSTEIGMIASHRFPMYRPKANQIDLDYLVYLFKTSRGKNLLELASPGGAGRNKTLGQMEFAKLQILVPPFPEQQKIAAVLSAADREIDTHQRQLDALKTQKKGLMQQLLTGKKRVVLDESDLPTAVEG